MENNQEPKDFYFGVMMDDDDDDDDDDKSHELPACSVYELNY